MPPRTALREKEWYIEDPKEFVRDSDKNSQLSELLSETWNDLSIVEVRRIEIGSSKGWQVTYRQ